MVMLSILATLLVALVLSTQLTDAGLDAQRLMDHAQARETNYLVARSAIEMGMEVLRADDNDADGPGDMWAVGELDIEWEGHPVSLRIVDEESRFPLGRLQADPDREPAPEMAKALVRLTRLAGLPNPEGAVDQLLDWVDADQARRPEGAEWGDYGSRPVKDAPLDSLSELEALPAWSQLPALPPPQRRGAPKMEEVQGAGPTGDLKASVPETQTLGAVASSQWSDWLSLRSSGLVNVNTAPPQLLLSLDPDLSEVTVQEIVRRRQDEAFKSSQELREVPGMDADLLFRLERMLGYRSNTFEIRAVVKEPPGSITVKAVVQRGQGPIRVLWWEVQ